VQDKKNREAILLIGGGGHCKSCIDVIETEGKYAIAGIVDSTLKVGEKILGYPVLGDDSKLPELRKKVSHVLITTGQIKSHEIRKKLSEILNKLEFNFPVIISPKAHVSLHSKIGKGSIILHHALINANVEIGEFCIVNSAALVEHDCQIGAYTHLSTGCRVNGNTIIGDDCFIGSGSILNQGIKITSETILGSGSLVLENINEKGTYFGQPAKRK
jgi:sugar O-acyltransferase (sialic acid O-acetyltransferase NeuD family)